MNMLIGYLLTARKKAKVVVNRIVLLAVLSLALGCQGQRRCVVPSSRLLIIPGRGVDGLVEIDSVHIDKCVSGIPSKYQCGGSCILLPTMGIAVNLNRDEKVESIGVVVSDAGRFFRDEKARVFGGRCRFENGIDIDVNALRREDIEAAYGTLPKIDEYDSDVGSYVLRPNFSVEIVGVNSQTLIYKERGIMFEFDGEELKYVLVVPKN